MVWCRCFGGRQEVPRAYGEQEPAREECKSAADVGKPGRDSRGLAVRTAHLCLHHLPALPPLCSQLQCSRLQPAPWPPSVQMTSTSSRSLLLVLAVMLHRQKKGGKCWPGAPTASQQLPPSHSQRASKSHSTSACFF